MIAYHGTPISGSKEMAPIFLMGRHALVSFAHSDQLQIVADNCSSFVFDNGAFSAWRSGNPIKNWEPYYDWVYEWHRHPGFDWAVIPDVIDGSESDNDELISEWPHGLVGVPVWHMHETLDRLTRLATTWPRVALGSSGQWAEVGSDGWTERMNEAMSAVCSDDDMRPICKLHGLRMLNPLVFSRWPLASADSTNCGQNGHREAVKQGLRCAAEGAVWIDERRLQGWNSAPAWEPLPVQEVLFR